MSDPKRRGPGRPEGKKKSKVSVTIDTKVLDLANEKARNNGEYLSTLTERALRRLLASNNQPGNEDA